MPLTPQGFTAKRFTDILSDINDELIQSLAADLNTSPDTLYGVLMNIIVSAISDQEELAQAVSDQFNLDKASGKWLDDIVAYIGLFRQGQTKTSGKVYLKGIPSLPVSTSVVFADRLSNRYRLILPITLDVATSHSAELSLSNPTAGLSYTVTLDGVPFTVTADAGSTVSSIALEFVNNINGSNIGVTASFDTGTNRLVLVDDDILGTFSIATNSNLIVQRIENITNVIAEQFGTIYAASGELSTIVTAVGGLFAVVNPLDLTTGRDIETDEELRLRHSFSVQQAGSGTLAAIVAAVRNIDGVTAVIGLENRTIFTNSLGLPAKSFEIIAEGGIDEEIADVIWDDKPAGIETYGNISELVVDFAGEPQEVRFSRPEGVYVWVEMTYSLYDEELFPIDGEDRMKQAIANYGVGYELGEDVIPTRLLTAIYQSVTGVGNITVRVGTSLSPVASSPDDIPYGTTPIEINQRQKASFAVNRVDLIQV